MNNNTIFGILYVIATPIGNLKDITYRALEILKIVDIIAAENILHTHKLLNEYNISNSLVSFNKINEQKKTIFLTELLLKGKNVALVSNAGTPTINDPGNYLIRYCYKLKIKVTVLPGACAAISALSISGLSNNRFIYEGFLPKSHTKRNLLIKSFANYPDITIIFYESPKRIIRTLNEIYNIFQDNCFIVIAKEITKVWETLYRGILSEILKSLDKDSYSHGEFVVILIINNSIRFRFLKKKFEYTINFLKYYLNKNKCIQIIKYLFNIKKNMIYKFLINK